MPNYIEMARAINEGNMPTDAEMLLALAEALCRGCAGTGEGISSTHGTCPDCDGTGARFPMLREPSENMHRPEYRPHEQTCECQGRGWVPSVRGVVEKVWDEVRQRGVVNFIPFAHEVIARTANWQKPREPMLTATLAAAVLMLAEEEKP